MANNFSIRDRDRAHVSKTRIDYLGENFEWIESWIRNNNFSLSLSVSIRTREGRMDADYGNETGRSSGSCHLDLHFRYAKNDRAHARYNNFSEPLFTEAIYGGKAAINKEFTIGERVACSRIRPSDL